MWAAAPQVPPGFTTSLARRRKGSWAGRRVTPGWGTVATDYRAPVWGRLVGLRLCLGSIFVVIAFRSKRARRGTLAPGTRAVNAVRPGQAVTTDRPRSRRRVTIWARHCCL